ncbi:MAG: ATP-grasp domain-containing protein [Monoraphidium minutum]|nr:MAG: ATP-grasp domain-containing protein [Monoraphidium minutum]
MASKKSALTAALSGAPAPAVAPKPASIFRPVLDNYAFPCLHHAPDDGTPVPDLSELVDGLEAIDLKSYTVVGSAPTRTSLPNGTPLADFPLDPYHRRGGKEVSSFAVSMDDKGSFSRAASGSLAQNYDAVIGSLPKGLSEDQRARIAASMPMSPALGMLGTMPEDKVSLRTVEGRRLRRSVLKGAVVAFITAGYSGKRFVFEKAAELGVKCIVIDAPDSWAQLMEGEGVISKFVPVDFSDAENVFDHCLEGVKAASAKLGGLDGITTFCEMAVPLVARLAEKLGLPSNSPDSVDAARDKYMTREAMAKAGLPTPRNSRVNCPEDVEPAGEYVGFPAVIKPVSGAASIGVIRVNSMEDLHAAYKRVARDMSRARVVAGALIEGKDGEEGADGNAGSWFNVHLMLEEYLDGPEIDCDLVMSDGVPVYGAITDNWPTVEPYFNETGSNCPSILPRKQQKELLELSVKSVQAMGLKLGVFHVEAKYTSRGARLIEVNCRMGGGPVRDTNLLVWGVDLVEEHLMTSVGIPARPPVAKRPLVQMAEYSINAKASGVIRDFAFLDPWAQHADVLYVRPLVPAGSKVVCVEDGLPTWICEIMVVKPTVQEAIDFIKSIEESLDIKIDPHPAKAK